MINHFTTYQPSSIVNIHQPIINADIFLDVFFCLPPSKTLRDWGTTSRNDSLGVQWQPLLSTVNCCETQVYSAHPQPLPRSLPRLDVGRLSSEAPVARKWHV